MGWRWEMPVPVEPSVAAVVAVGYRSQYPVQTALQAPTLLGQVC